jgi:hypothetical protein
MGNNNNNYNKQKGAFIPNSQPKTADDTLIVADESQATDDTKMADEAIETETTQTNATATEAATEEAVATDTNAENAEVQADAPAEEVEVKEDVQTTTATVINEPVVNTTAASTTTTASSNDINNIFSQPVMQMYARSYINEITVSRNPDAAIKDLLQLIRAALRTDTVEVYNELLNFFVSYSSSIMVEHVALQGVTKLTAKDHAVVTSIYTIMRMISTDTMFKNGFDTTIVDYQFSKYPIFQNWVKTINHQQKKVSK